MSSNKLVLPSAPSTVMYSEQGAVSCMDWVSVVVSDISDGTKKQVVVSVKLANPQVQPLAASVAPSYVHMCKCFVCQRTRK